MPLAPGEFEKLPPSLLLDALVLERKPEFHVTVLNREVAARLRAQEANGVVGPALPELFAMQDWRWSLTGERWLLRKDKPEGTAHSVIELLDMPALNRFRHHAGRAHAEKLPPTPAHVTLYVAGDPIGIGLADQEEFERLRVRRL